jgi:hypothetical protein
MNCRFKDIFQEVYEENWKEKFEENSIWFVLIYRDFDYDSFCWSVSELPTLPYQLELLG